MRAGVQVDGIFHPTRKGTPQGGVISPILSNIYLNEFDEYLEKLIENKNSPIVTIANEEYVKAKSLLRSSKNRKADYKKLRQIPSKKIVGTKIHYIRYADDWMIGVDGSLTLTRQINDDVSKFLEEKLELRLSQNKHKVIDLQKAEAKFLGFHIASWKNKSNHLVTKGKVKKRASTVKTRIKIPYDDIKDKLISEGFMDTKYRVKGITKWIYLNHDDIIVRYNYIIRGLYNYYRLADNAAELRKFIDFILVHSCAKTLGRKYRLKSRKKVYKKFGNRLKKDNISIMMFDDVKKRKEKTSVKVGVNQIFKIVE